MAEAITDTWITDTRISTRFPYYTRANADEVGPEPFSPLGWSLGWAKGCIPGVAEGFVRFGVVRRDEFALDPPEVFGNWGGYFYNQLSLPRVMGVRMPGATWEAIDLAYFGDHPGVPSYTPHPDDDDDVQSAKLAETMGWAMSTTSYPEQERIAEISLQHVADRPDLASLSNAELVQRARELAGPGLEAAWTVYCQTVLAASLGPGAVQAICAAIGREGDAVKLLTAVGSVESADAPIKMWEMSRTIRNSPALTAEFDAGPDGLLERLVASDDPAAATFRSQWDDLIATFGHRGPNEWDLRAHSWTTRPSMPLGMLERMRLQDDGKSPLEARARGAAIREELTTELLGMVEGDPEAHGGLQAGIASAGLFAGLREMGKNACIRLIHEAKLALMELGRPDGRRGCHRRSPADLHAARRRGRRVPRRPGLDVATRCVNATGCSITCRRSSRRTSSSSKTVYLRSRPGPFAGAAEGVTAVAGDVLQGAMGSPGVVTGIARVILDPSDAGAIGPGDIMIAPTTDPSWVPLFLSAEGVVVNVGAVGSHAAIMCRELGIPCAVSVIDATERIPDGATIEIDGSTGAVTIVASP